MFKLLLSALLVIFSTSLASAQSRIVTTSGNVFIGSVLDEDKFEISIRTADGIDIKVPRDKIESISYGRTAPAITPSSPTSAPISSSTQESFSATPSIGAEDDGHLAFGIAIGTPGGLGLAAAYHQQGFGARFSLMALPEDFGLQTSMLQQIAKTGPMEFKVGLISGFSYVGGDRSTNYEDYSWLYTGPAASIELFGMFTEVGLSFGFGSYSNPQVMYQLGYAYHLN
jgi:hypothetical protein